jgi:acyl-CoA reductase-like NAD-dependent aldehyde dehydrogenase
MTTMKHVTHWIGGKPWPGASGATGDIYDPATGQISGTVDFATAAEVDHAVVAATRPRPPGGTCRWPAAPRSCSPSASWSGRTPTGWPR